MARTQHTSKHNPIHVSLSSFLSSVRTSALTFLNAAFFTAGSIRILTGHSAPATSLRFKRISTTVGAFLEDVTGFGMMGVLRDNCKALLEMSSMSRGDDGNIVEGLRKGFYKSHVQALLKSTLRLNVTETFESLL